MKIFIGLVGGLILFILGVSWLGSFFLNGASWSIIASLVIISTAVGIIFFCIGYLFWDA